MQPTRVALVLLGKNKHHLNLRYLEKWKSDILQITHGRSIGQMPNAQGKNWTYTDAQFLGLITPVPDADVTIAITSMPLEDNYYMRRLNNQIGVISLYEMAEMLLFFNFTLENFVIRNLYEIAVLHQANAGLIPTDLRNWTHDDIRGCLFDMNATKLDIIFSMDKPLLCDDCRNRVLGKAIDPLLLPTLTSELKKIRKAFMFRIVELGKRHPWMALTMSSFSAIIVGVIASALYDWAKQALS